MATNRRHGERLSYYEFGATTLFASRADQRFSYCLYVPQEYEENGEAVYPLAVIIHGTTRTAQKYRDLFSDFAEANRCVVLAPLFPAGILEPYELDNYKFIEYRGIRFDSILLGIIDEAAERYRVEADRFLMHGFSGGGHFANRFYFLHPDRLLGVSIGAPGLITLADDDKPWWVGTADLAERFGSPLALDRLRNVPVHMVIGAEDNETWEINDCNSRHWMPGAYDAGKTRLDRLSALKENLEGHGVEVRYDAVPGVAHNGYEVLEPVKEFFAGVLTDHHG